MKTKKELHLGQCSYYPLKNSMKNEVITLQMFVSTILSARWKERVEEFRQLIKRGDKRAAENVKGKMPCLVVAGVCEGGHAKVNFRTFSGYLMIDIDHFKGDIRMLLNRLKALAWTQTGWVTISGEGLKVVFRVDATTQEEYEKMAYPIVMNYVSRLLEVPVDKSCADLTRTCYASYDPEAFWKETPCEVYPWREEAEALAAQGLNPDGTPIKEKSATQTSVASEAKGLVHSFLDAFLESYPYVPNHRHKFLLSLGREARRYGMNDEEMSQLVDLAIETLAMPDCDGPEIRSNLLDAYAFADEKGLANHRKRGFKGQWVHHVPTSAPVDDPEAEEDKKDANRAVRLSAPYFPDWIFDQLPELLKQGLSVAKDRRQRDMLLLGMLVNLSGCMPSVRMLYDDTDIYPHFFLSVIASAASGKGILAHAAKLGCGIQKMLEEEGDAHQREYEEAQMLWEQERQRALKEHRKPDINLRPEPVKRRTLMVPADISRTQLIQLMSGSPHGVLLNVSEMDTLRAAVSTEYGRFDDLMRACFHHEMFGSDFKQDKQQHMVYCPKMAFCGSGTPTQFYRLCPSPENGAYSRYLIYMAEQDTEFRRMAPGDERRNKNRVFRILSERVLEMYRYLLARPTEVKLTPQQWDWHESYFQSALQDVKIEESEGPMAVVFRHGLNASRLAMVLTALRKFEAQWDFYEMTCSDDDFRIVMAMMEVLLCHSLTLSTSLRAEPSSPGVMRSYYQVRKALEKLPSEFRYHELIEALRSEGLSQSSAKRTRQRLIDRQVIVHEGEIYRFVNRQWRSRLKG